MKNPLITIQSTNTILYCKNWAETVRFYKKKLLLPVTHKNDWFVEFRLTDSAHLSIANSARAIRFDRHQIIIIQPDILRQQAYL